VVKEGRREKTMSSRKAFGRGCMKGVHQLNMQYEAGKLRKKNCERRNVREKLKRQLRSRIRLHG